MSISTSARARFYRLFSALLDSTEGVGLGVDEDSAVAIEDSTFLEVIGRHDGTEQAVIFVREGGKKFRVELLGDGDRYDLKKRERIEDTPGEWKATGTL